MKDIRIEINDEILRFRNHLELPSNHQTIISGIFGIGKTYFIKEFFNTYKDKYEIVYLTPVHYVVSSNEDILEYIKRDIAFELFSKDVEFEKEEFSKLLTSQMFVVSNLVSISKTILESASKLNKYSESLYKPLSNLISSYEKFHSESQVNAQKEVETYFKEFEERVGVIYENDRITEIVSSIISFIKKNGKEIVLVIDDIDRIDPEHIFRLFNVFACHFDYNQPENNKFGFDKIIFVCDIENIRNIFHSRYGTNVDFTGYIDKFYSRDIFHYDNKSIILKNITKLLRNIELPPEYKGFLDFNYNSFGLTHELTQLFVALINSNAINLRTLIKLLKEPYISPKYFIEFDEGYNNISNICSNTAIIYDFLQILFNTSKGIELALIKCEQHNNFIKVNSPNLTRTGFLISILDYDHNKFKEGEYEYSNSELNLYFHYKIEIHGEHYNRVTGNILAAKILNDRDVDIDKIPYFTLLRLTLVKFNTFIKNWNFN